LAYNEYGGRSLYFGPGMTHAKSVANRSYVASADRPVDGSGMRTVFTMNIPLIRFLSRKKISYDVTTDSSLDATPGQFVGQTTVLIGGHSEYWTKRMYDAAVQARDAGSNFGFLGANEVYWQGRIERDQKGRETALTVYRDSKLDRLAKSNPSTTTVQWRHPPLLRDPAALVGVGMSVVGCSWRLRREHRAVLALRRDETAQGRRPRTGLRQRGGRPGAANRALPSQPSGRAPRGSRRGWQLPAAHGHSRLLQRAQRRRCLRSRDDPLGLRP